MVDQHKNTVPRIMILGGILLLFIGLIWVVINQTVSPNAAPATATPASVSQVQRVSLQDAKTAFDQGAAVFLDVRNRSTSEAAHIPGAALIPLDELTNRMGELNSSAWIIPY